MTTRRRRSSRSVKSTADPDSASLTPENLTDPRQTATRKNNPSAGLAAQISRKETLFFDALRNLFVGAEVEGDSGYINWGLYI
jgi:hypothetical protein